MIGKKGQAITFENAPKMILILVFLGMVVAAGIISLSSFRTSSYSTATHTDVQSTADNASTFYFADTTERVNSCSGATFTNGTNAVDITGNLTVTEASCTAILTAEGGIYDGETINASYTATLANTASDVMNNTIRGGNNFSDQLPTVGTMLGVGLILLVVLGVFAAFAMGKLTVR